MSTNFELDHIGIAVKSLKDSFKFYEAMGWRGMKIEDVKSEGVKVGFLELANEVDIELLEPTTQDGPVAKFLGSRGPGVHHICIRVENLKSTLEQLKKAGIRLIDEEPRKGAKRCWVAFVHPSSVSGVLVELSQPMAKDE